MHSRNTRQESCKIFGCDYSTYSQLAKLEVCFGMLSASEKFLIGYDGIKLRYWLLGNG